MRTRTFSELKRFSTIEDRFSYLKLDGFVAEETFGFDRWMNQAFYSSNEWKVARRDTIARDEGFEMGLRDWPIAGRLYIHHMNPMRSDDIKYNNSDILNPEYLITVSHNTHNAIHYGDPSQLPQPMVERRPGDTQLWVPLSKKGNR